MIFLRAVNDTWGICLSQPWLAKISKILRFHRPLPFILVKKQQQMKLFSVENSWVPPCLNSFTVLLQWVGGAEILAEMAKSTNRRRWIPSWKQMRATASPLRGWRCTGWTSMIGKSQEAAPTLDSCRRGWYGVKSTHLFRLNSASDRDASSLTLKPLPQLF